MSEANEGSVMLPRGRGEAENRACEGLGFAEVLKPSRFRPVSVDFEENGPKSSKNGQKSMILSQNRPKLAVFGPKIKDFGTFLDQNGPKINFLFRLENDF